MDDDGFDLEFDPWYPGQTDDDGGEVNCVVMNPEGKQIEIDEPNDHVS